MFGFFKKKSKIEKLIDKDGLEYVTARFAEIIAEKIPNREAAYQFILEELDGASKGNSESKKFAAESGIPASLYEGALEHSDADIDGPDTPQQMLLGISLQLIKKPALMAQFRCKIDDKIMQKFHLGRYSGEGNKLQPESTEIVKGDTAELLTALVRKQGIEDDQISFGHMRKLVQNVSVYLRESDIKNAGTKVLALHCLSNVTANSIDNGEIQMANMYAACACELVASELTGNSNSLDAYQQAAFHKIYKDFQLVIKELEIANG